MTQTRSAWVPNFEKQTRSAFWIVDGVRYGLWTTACGGEQVVGGWSCIKSSSKWLKVWALYNEETPGTMYPQSNLLG